MNHRVDLWSTASKRNEILVRVRYMHSSASGCKLNVIGPRPADRGGPVVEFRLRSLLRCAVWGTIGLHRDRKVGYGLHLC